MAFAAFSSAPSKAASGPVKASRFVWVLLLPGVFYLGMFFLVPLISLIITSLGTPDYNSINFGAYSYGFDLSNYAAALESYYPQIARSFGYALAATIFALLISYPLAYFIGVKLRSRPLLQKLTLTLVIAPFFISFLLRTIAWKQMLADNSPFMDLLKNTHLVATDFQFIGTPAAVIFGLTYNFIPFMTLPLYTALERLDIRYLEAASDLYASPRTVFGRVTLPLTLPGVISGTLLTFIPITGDYVNASQDFLGSSQTSMIGTMVESEFLKLGNYPQASALSAILMAAIVILVALYVRRTGTEDLL
ncbi:MAG: ABC transporter permease [Micrococcales bacterium]